jgi:ClpP class serine protease
MKAHALHKLTASLYGRPHLISRDAFQSISSYLNSRNANLMTFPDDPEEEPVEQQEGFDTNFGIGVISILGPLTYRSTGWEALCGGYSYEMLLEQASDLIADGVKTLVIECDSGGGEAYGCFETANELRKMCDDNGVTLYGYIDGCACSAMYALICVCDEIIINEYAEAGSIGVLIALYNDSEALKMEGYERIFITDGTEKVPFNDDGTFREGFLADLQKRCTELGDAFRAHVSMYTGISTEELKATNAKVFSAQDALSLGLVNQIQTRSEFVSYVVDKHKGV